MNSIHGSMPGDSEAIQKVLEAAANATETLDTIQDVEGKLASGEPVPEEDMQKAVVEVANYKPTPPGSIFDKKE
ncbi:MAG: hypothetical protein SFU25_02065 [Candidatus Caenarcaniphilales bacterium]|nr:hypothetical protein [Candidatus Caenarcaniphilales bacterium]